MNFQIETIEDQWDPRVTEFRSSLFVELGANPSDLTLEIDYKATHQHFAEFEPSIREELWKFGDSKWRETKFDNIECVLVDGRVVSISGCRMYSGGMLRVAMHLFTLPSYRKFVRNIQFRSDGFFARHLQYGQSKAAEVLFMTVYAHTSKLVSHAKNLGRRRISPDGGKMEFIHELIPAPEPILFHNVSQYFFLYKLKPEYVFDGRAPAPLHSFTQPNISRSHDHTQ